MTHQEARPLLSKVNANHVHGYSPGRLLVVNVAGSPPRLVLQTSDIGWNKTYGDGGALLDANRHPAVHIPPDWPYELTGGHGPG